MKKIFGALSFISFFMLYGIAGAYEAGNISLIQFVLQSVFFLILFTAFAKLAGAFDYSKD